MPPAWKVTEYVTWSARLAGHSRGDAEQRTKDALARLKLEALAGTRLAHAPLAARRATSIAAAMATGATTLFVEDPLRDLPEDTARTFARVLVKATAGLRMALFAGRASLSSPISMDADEAVVLDGSLVLGQGAPAEVAASEHCYALRVHGRGARFAQLAEARGARVSGNGSRWTVDLGTSLRVTDMIDVAMASDTVILELRPLAHAFA
jgi:ABC-type multidrug transport system ATPase subunit